jgi:beta-N-acetylhexosaminidase
MPISKCIAAVLVVALALTLTVNLSAVTSPASASAQSSDPITRRVDALMSVMTTEQKVGQLFLVAFSGPRLSRSLKRMIEQFHIGGIVLFDSAGNILNVKQTVKLINDAQAAAVANEGGARIPLFVAADEEGGTVSRLPRVATWFPSQMALGAADSVELARGMARTAATEMKALGINMNLAPVLDVNDQPANPVIGTRSFSSEPERVARLGAAMLQEYEAQGILATAKHFPGHGFTYLDSHDDLPLSNRTTTGTLTIDLAPFERAVRAGADAIMTAHVVYPGLDASTPATLSPRILQDLLRRKLGYQGLIVSDSLLMRALTGNASLNDVTVAAFKAGVDVLAIGADAGYTRLDRRTTYQAVLDAVNADPALKRRLDESVRRILTAKARYGVLDQQPADAEQAAQVLGSDAHRALAQRIAQASVTLVRDAGKQVPLRPGSKALLVLPSGAANLAAPLQACHGRENVAVARMRLDPRARDATALAKRAAKYDVVIVASWNTRNFPGQALVIEALQAQGKPVIVVALQSPYDLLSFPTAPTYLTAYSDVPVSLQAIADVLCGRAAAPGKLPVALALRP